MRRVDTAPQKISVIIPAYNEESTIEDVVQIAISHPSVDEVIVVSDGSTDRTAVIAKRAGAHVIELPENFGKGAALSIGVEEASSQLLLFLDADLSGLTHAMITRLAFLVSGGEYGMFTLVRDHPSEQFQLHSPSWIVGGERALKRALWDMVPEQERRGFQIELALNFYAKKYKYNTGCELAPGLRHRSKEQKRGFLLGLWLRTCMWTLCLATYVRLFVFHAERV